MSFVSFLIQFLEYGPNSKPELTLNGARKYVSTLEIYSHHTQCVIIAMPHRIQSSHAFPHSIQTKYKYRTRKLASYWQLTQKRAHALKTHTARGARK